MKKIFTLFAMGLLASGSISARVATPEVRTDLKIVADQHSAQKLRVATAKAERLAALGDNENNFTRSWVDRSGNVWLAQMLKMEVPLCEMVSFADKDGNPYQPTFEQLPYYCVNYRLQMRPKDSPAITTQCWFYMAWPTKYLYEQVFTYDGERTENGGIPQEYRDLTIVPFDELANNPEGCRKFQESTGVGAQESQDGYSWEYWTMLPNALLGIPCYLNGQECVTSDPDGPTPSNITINAFRAEDVYLDITNRITCDSDGNVRNLARNQYQGTFRFEGFAAQVDDLPEFGDIHLFNAGLQSSEEMGDENPFTAEWPEMTWMYMVGGDTRIEWELDPTAKKFDPQMIRMKAFNVAADEEEDDFANMMQGYLFAPAKYAQDLTLTPDTEAFEMIEPTEGYDADVDKYYWVVAPAANSMLPYGWGTAEDIWSTTYGMVTRVRNVVDFIVAPSKLQFGTKEGFMVFANNEFLKTININSKGNLIYHYDPNDMQLTRVVPLVGDVEWDNSVAEVAEGVAKVVAANGELTVVPAEKSVVAVYALDGACVAKATVFGGETFTVAAPKGIYVVKVGNETYKLAL